MTARGGRAVPVVVAAVIIFIAVYKGHSAPSGDAVAFVYEQLGVRIMICGKVKKPGIYTVASPERAHIVNVMTVAGAEPDLDYSGFDVTTVCDGTVFTVGHENAKNQGLTLSRMQLRERVYLGIPVDLNLLSVREWEWLPEIGPRLAEALVADRQYNGDFSGFEGLERVSGIGETRVKRIKKFIIRQN